MKGLAFNIMFGLVIAFVGVVLFISFVTGAFQTAVNWLYCDVIIKTVTFFSGQETASIPRSCLPKDETPPIVEIRFQDNNNVSRQILTYIISCWQQTEIKQLYKTHSCFELHLMKDVDSVTEANVTSILTIEDHCRSIENSDYGCGVKDQILWNIDGNVINTQKIILIRYDNSTKAVRVIG